jgi:hypothetical protein
MCFLYAEASVSEHGPLLSTFRGMIRGMIRLSKDDLGCFSVPPMLLESISYSHKFTCHGRGRGFELRRPRHTKQKALYGISSDNQIRVQYGFKSPCHSRQLPRLCAGGA